MPGVHVDPFQRCSCTSNGGVPPMVTHICACRPVSMMALCGCCVMVGAAIVCTVSTAPWLNTRPAPL